MIDVRDTAHPPPPRRRRRRLRPCGGRRLRARRPAVAAPRPRRRRSVRTRRSSTCSTTCGSSRATAIDAFAPPLHSQVLTAALAVGESRSALSGRPPRARAPTRDARRPLPRHARRARAHGRLGSPLLPALRPAAGRAVAAARPACVGRGRPPGRACSRTPCSFPSDPGGHVLEQNDVAVLLRSDSLDHIAAPRDGLRGPAHLFDGHEQPPRLRRRRLRRRPSLPKRLALAAGVPGAHLIPDGAELFLGFTSTQSSLPAGSGSPTSRRSGMRRSGRTTTSRMARTCTSRTCSRTSRPGTASRAGSGSPPPSTPGSLSPRKRSRCPGHRTFRRPVRSCTTTPAPGGSATAARSRPSHAWARTSSAPTGRLRAGNARASPRRLQHPRQPVCLDSQPGRTTEPAPGRRGSISSSSTRRATTSPAGGWRWTGSSRAAAGCGSTGDRRGGDQRRPDRDAPAELPRPAPPAPLVPSFRAPGLILAAGPGRGRRSPRRTRRDGERRRERRRRPRERPADLRAEVALLGRGARRGRPLRAAAEGDRLRLLRRLRRSLRGAGARAGAARAPGGDGTPSAGRRVRPPPQGGDRPDRDHLRRERRRARLPRPLPARWQRGGARPTAVARGRGDLVHERDRVRALVLGARRRRPAGAPARPESAAGLRATPR